MGTLGYELIGGRLLPGNAGPVAQFMYHDSSGQRLTLYVSTEQTVSRDTGFRFAREGAVNVFTGLMASLVMRFRPGSTRVNWRGGNGSL